MKVKVNDRCIGCGACVAITDGQLFDFNDAGLATAIKEEVDKDLEDLAEDAINGCPTGAIEKID